MRNYKILLFVFVSVSIVSCKKDWIKIKPNKSVDVPTSVADFQALLDNSTIMNDIRPYLGEVSADNYYVTYNYWQTLPSLVDKNAYVWAGDVYDGYPTDGPNWNNSYRQVFYSNLVLDDIDKVGSEEKNTQEWNNVKGSALYYRGEAFFNVSQIYTRPYSLTFPDYAGIPL
ncbi:MAG: RagB/SusD family nutrient uptake outer membrane protein, partial [Niastella sp.]|uniref:RagB/SusD family nutrient uptake outer membrane protein n=1 Tax=Niastella sp. TaxID=1869183 RepID=UPI00389B3191